MRKPDINAAMDQLILRIHALPFSPSDFPSVLDDIRKVASAQSIAALTTDGTNADRFRCIAVNVSDEALVDYSANFISEDPWLNGATARGRLRTGLVSCDDDLVCRKTFLNSRFRNEFAAPNDIDRFMSLVMTAGTGSSGPPTMTMSLFKSNGGKNFSDADSAILARLAPHLPLAASNSWRARGLEFNSLLRTSALDLLAHPVVMIDESGQVAMANCAAEATLARRQWLQISRRKLAPAPSLASPKRCTDALAALALGRGATLQLIDAAHHQQAILMTLPIARSGDADFSQTKGIGLVWLMPLAPSLNAVDSVARLYALTTAEVRVLRTLILHEDLRATANLLAMSIHTARTHLKSILRKSGRRTQGQLFALAARMPLSPGPTEDHFQ